MWISFKYGIKRIFLDLLAVLARGSCHCEPCRKHGMAISLPHDSCHSRWSEKIFPRSLSVSLPRATLVAWWTQSACKQHLFLDYFATLVMTRAKMAARLKASRHDNLLLDRRTAFAMTIRTPFARTIRTALGHGKLSKLICRDARL